MVCATRPEEPGADQDLLDALAAAARPLIRPAPLSPEAAGTFIRARIPDAVEEFATACHAATGGNPFLLGELASEVAEERLGGSAADAGRVLEFGSERVGRAIRRRLRALDEDATDVARAVAVLGPPVSLDDVLGLTGLARAPATGGGRSAGRHQRPDRRPGAGLHPPSRARRRLRPDPAAPAPGAPRARRGPDDRPRRRERTGRPPSSPAAGRRRSRAGRHAAHGGSGCRRTRRRRRSHRVPPAGRGRAPAPGRACRRPARARSGGGR